MQVVVPWACWHIMHIIWNT